MSLDIAGRAANGVNPDQMSWSTLFAQACQPQCLGLLRRLEATLTSIAADDLMGERSADDILKYFSYFFAENSLLTFMRIVSWETFCMKCQCLFSGLDRKVSSVCRLRNLSK